MKETKTLLYDGSFNGFLTAVFTGFEEKANGLNIKKSTTKSHEIFSNTKIIFTDMDKALRVWNTIQNKNNAAIKNIYFAFLSKSKDIENLLYLYIKSIFNPHQALQNGYSIAIQIKLEDIAKSVAKEKKQLEKTLQFKQSKDAIYYTNIAPNADVLPLLSKYFRIHFSNQPWLIFDVKRNYGIYYNTYGTEIISLSINPKINSLKGINNRTTKATQEKIQVLNEHFNKTNLKSLVINKVYTSNFVYQNNSNTMNKAAI